jgi:hypothetical protein
VAYDALRSSTLSGRTVLGFVADTACADPTRDITGHGGWRSYLTIDEPPARW